MNRSCFSFLTRNHHRLFTGSLIFDMDTFFGALVIKGLLNVSDHSTGAN